MDRLIGSTFLYKHGGGVTEYRVTRPHRDLGYYECVATRAISGTHHFLGSIQIFRAQDIRARLEAA